MSVRELVAPDGRTQMALDQDYRLFDISGAGDAFSEAKLEVVTSKQSYL